MIEKIGTEDIQEKKVAFRHHRFKHRSIVRILRNYRDSDQYPFSTMRNTRNEKLKMIVENARKHILSLPENWDDEGAVKIPEEIFKRAEELFLALFEKINLIKFESYPVINPVPDGSIDIEWRTDEFSILIEVDDEGIGCYGVDKRDDNRTFDLSASMATTIEFLQYWIIGVERRKMSWYYLKLRK